LDPVSGSHCCNPGGFHLFLRRADGSFAERAYVNFAKPMRFVTGTSWPYLVDWNRDGHTDLVIGYPGSWTLQVGLGPLAGKKDLALKPTNLPPAAGRASPLHFAFADWDGDGRLDLLVGVDRGVQPGRYSIYWLRNTSDAGPLRFAEPSHLLDIPEPWDLRALTTVDWGHEGHPSLVVSVSKGSTLSERAQGWWPVASELWLYRRTAEPRIAPDHAGR
jgi:hypothetical protein